VVAILEEVGESPPMVKIDPHAVRLRHARYYQQVAHRAEKELYQQGKQLEGLTLFDQERSQIDAGWEWVARQSPTDETDRLLMNLTNTTSYIGAIRYDLRQERMPQLLACLDAAHRQNRREVQSAALGNLGLACFNFGDMSRAIEYFEQALAISRDISDKHGESSDLGNLGLAFHAMGAYLQAIDYYQLHLDLARALNEQRGEATALIEKPARSRTTMR
jgi:tetratricopeptide (TPR) repeat protein